MKRACPRVRFVREALNPNDRLGPVAIKAFVGPRQVGIITIRNLISVGFVDVHPGMQRCGLGTRLYEKAAKITCEGGHGLRSDIERTAASQGFWEKQVRKGRAECAERVEPQTAPDNESILGRGGCDHYRLKCPAPTSLAGRKRRQRR